MAPQSCVMNLAQGSPPSAAPGEATPEDRATCGVGTDKLALSPTRRCKSKGSDLPFSVESLISDRTPPSRSLHSPEPPGCVRTEETECASPSGVYRSKPEAAELSDKETSTWFQGQYTSPTSEFNHICFCRKYGKYETNPAVQMILFCFFF